MSKFDYERRDVHLCYDRARSLSDEALRLWLDTIRRHLGAQRPRAIADVGCGTGRFAAALADYFRARVYAVDPSRKMLGVARARLGGAEVELLEGRAESLPIASGAVELVFLSMVYHHLEDRRRAASEFRRVLRDEGRLVIRTPTRERLSTFLWLKFFPAAQAIETQRTPSHREVVETLEQHGFRLAAHEVVRQQFTATLTEYYEKLSLRGLSTLAAISDEDFGEGLARLKSFCQSQATERAVEEELDLFVFAPG